MNGQRDEIALRDRQAEEFEELYLGKGSLYDCAEKSAIYNALNLQRDDIVLDAGCGTGRLTKDIAKRCRKVYAVDFSSKSIEVLKRRSWEEGIGNISAYVHDITNPLPIDEKVSKIVSVQVIQHIPSDDKRREALANLYTLLRPSGVCVITLYNWRAFKKEGSPKEGNFGGGIYYFRFTPKEAKALFEKCGFKKITIKGCVNFGGYARLRSSWSRMLFYPYCALDALIAGFSVSQYLGDFLLCKGVKS